jgi:hypothetical protein
LCGINKTEIQEPDTTEQPARADQKNKLSTQRSLYLLRTTLHSSTSFHGCDHFALRVRIDRSRATLFLQSKDRGMNTLALWLQRVQPTNRLTSIITFFITI